MRVTESRGTLIALLLVAPLLSGFDPFRSANGDVEQGNAKLGANKYKEALSHYDAAAKKLPDAPGVQYNRGIALHRLGRHKEAAEALGKATRTRDPELKRKSFFNLGSALLQQKKFKEAAEAFKGALRLAPWHRPSKWNLELALKQDDKKQDDKKQDDKKQDQQKKQDDKKQDQQKKQQQKKQQQKKQPSPSRRRMNSVLDALDRRDKNLQKRRARMRRGGLQRPTKDW